MSQLAILKQWPWNTPVIYFFSLMYFVVWLVFTVYLWHLYSYTALIAIILLIPPGFYIYRSLKINKMIKVLKGCISARNGETVEGMVCLHGKTSPGITIMRDNQFILIPVTGRRTKIFFETITSVNEMKTMSLKYLFSKRVFNVAAGENKVVSFIVREPVGKRWSVYLTERLTK